MSTQPFIFFVEGAITVAFGIVCMFMLPHTPSHVRFFNQEELAACLARMRLDAHGSNPAAEVGDEKFSWYWVRRALLNVNTILLSLD